MRGAACFELHVVFVQLSSHSSDAFRDQYIRAIRSCATHVSCQPCPKGPWKATAVVLWQPRSTAS